MAQLNPLRIGESFLQGRQFGENLKSSRLNRLIAEQENERAGEMHALDTQLKQQAIRGGEKALTMDDFKSNILGIGMLGAAIKDANPQNMAEVEQTYNMMIPRLKEAGFDVTGAETFSPEILPAIGRVYQMARSANLLQDPNALGASANITKSSKTFSNGLTVQSTGTGVRVISPAGQELTGEAAAKAIEEANAQEVSQQKDIYAAREGGKLDTQIEKKPQLEDLVARAKKNAENSTEQIKIYFGQVENIGRNIANLEEAKRLVLEEGANTGAIAGRLPSVQAAAVKLQNLQGQLGLDVIGNTTFGALSEAELAFALNTALPTNLEGKELADWLDRKIDAQSKLANYLTNAIEFLNIPGNDLADLQAAKSPQQAFGREGSANVPKYSVGQVITGPDGNQYRVIGGDMNDPDVEPVQ